MRILLVPTTKPVKMRLFASNEWNIVQVLLWHGVVDEKEVQLVGVACWNGGAQCLARTMDL